MTKLSSENQITLPLEVVREANLSPGDELLVRADGDGRVVLISGRNRVSAWAGEFPDLSAAADPQSLRDEWEQ